LAEAVGQILGIDWGMVGAALTFLGIVVGAVITLVLYQHGQLLAQVKDEQDRARIREQLTTDAGIASRFGDGIAGLMTCIDGYFGPRLGWRAFDRCLLHAYLYPILLFVAAWVAGASGELGAVEVLSTTAWWQRLLTALAMTFAVAWGFVVFPRMSEVQRASRQYVQSWLEKSSLASHEPVSRFKLSRNLLIAGIFLLTIVPLTFVVNFSFVFLGVGIVIVVGGTISELIIFAIVALFVICGSPAGKIAIVVMIAIAFSFTFAGAAAATTILLLYVALPIANAALDWLSWAVTRSLMRRSTNWAGAALNAISIASRLALDLGLAFVSLCVLALLLPNVVEGTNWLFGWLEWPTIAWLPLLNQALEAPFTQGVFVTGMLLTTLVPTLLHVAAGLFRLFVVWSGGGSAMAARMPVDATTPIVESDCQAVAWFLLRRRLWLIPATIATVLLVVPLAWLLTALTGPIGIFLGDLALCGTSWSHGLCPLWD
jgi:hypothetical protein